MAGLVTLGLMYYLFTEDINGKLGYVGQEYFSMVQAEDKAEDYGGITHIVEGRDLAEAKRKLRDRLVRKKKDPSLLYISLAII